VPGFVSNVQDWWQEPTCVRFFDRLTSFTRLILFDKRGTGRSDRVVQTPTLEQRVDDIRAVLDAVGSPRAALLGISEGGALAAVFAATHPQRTSALILYATIAAFISWIPTPEELRHVLESIDRTWGTGASLPRYAPSMAGDERFRRWWARHEREGGSPGTVMDLMRMNSEIDIRPILPSVRVPTLVLHRVDDVAVDVESGRYLCRHIPGAQYVELPGRDHVPWVGNAEAILDEVEEFITGVRPAASVNDVLATILVADVAGASRRCRRGTSAARGLLDRPDAYRARSRSAARRRVPGDRRRRRCVQRGRGARLAAGDRLALRPAHPTRRPSKPDRGRGGRLSAPR
jgi:pimeloyl-ACP methyl ester carboxylesterase